MRSPDQPRIDANEHERKYWDLCHQIVGVFYSVYNELGFVIGLIEAGLKVTRQVATPIWFRGRAIREYKADLVVNNAVLLELKAARVLDPSQRPKS